MKARVHLPYCTCDECFPPLPEHVAEMLAQAEEAERRERVKAECRRKNAMNVTRGEFEKLLARVEAIEKQIPGLLR